ncbi:hypothetical protein ACN47E_008043 [Coniothyrium glycines]
MRPASQKNTNTSQPGPYDAGWVKGIWIVGNVLDQISGPAVASNLTGSFKYPSNLVMTTWNWAHAKVFKSSLEYILPWAQEASDWDSWASDLTG